MLIKFKYEENTFSYKQMKKALEFYLLKNSKKWKMYAHHEASSNKYTIYHDSKPDPTSLIRNEIFIDSEN